MWRELIGPESNAPSFMSRLSRLIWELLIESFDAQFSTQTGVILFRYVFSIELTEEAPKAKGFVRFRIFFDGKHNFENLLSRSISICRKPFSQPAGASKYVNDWDHGECSRIIGTS
jgi:hypothetical protein